MKLHYVLALVKQELIIELPFSASSTQETCKIHIVAYSIIWSSLHSVCSVS